MKAEEERKKKEAEEEAANRAKGYRPPSGLRGKNNYTIQTNNKSSITESDPSLFDADSMEEALEELAEGGGF